MFDRWKQRRNIARRLRTCPIRKVRRCEYHNPTVMRKLPGKFLRGLMLVAALMFTTACAESTCYVTGIPTDEYLRVRESPSIHSAEIGKLWYGDAVTIESYSDGWALVAGVSNETGSGYVMVGYLTDALVDPFTAVTTASVKMRDLPCGEPIKKLRKGATVTVLGVLSIDGVEWAQTENGWIMSQYLKEETKWNTR